MHNSVVFFAPILMMVSPSIRYGKNASVVALKNSDIPILQYFVG